MKFARVGEPGREIPVLVTKSGYYDLRGITPDIDGPFLGSGFDAVHEAFRSGQLPKVVDAEAMRIGAPIARPGAVICVGMNYAAHAAESGSAPPEHVVIFQKTPNTVVGPNDQVTIPLNSSKTDWEVELAVVIGARASYLHGPEQAAQHIAGYTIVNDLSEREWQIELSGGQWGKGKSAPGFSPTGPWLVTADEVTAQELGLRSWVNGEPRQNSHTKDMIFPVHYLIWHLSQFMTLDPGDMVLTGTPEGVALSGKFPYLSPGDTVELEIDGLGRQRQSFIAYQEDIDGV